MTTQISPTWDLSDDDRTPAEAFARRAVALYYASPKVEVQFPSSEPPPAFLDALRAGGWTDVRWEPFSASTTDPDVGDGGWVKMIGTHAMTEARDALHLFVRLCAQATGADADLETFIMSVPEPADAKE